jgi:hypothetical protein
MEGGGFQNDVRMTYCASVVMSVIQRYELDVPSARHFIRRCRASFMRLHVYSRSDLVDMGRRVRISSRSDRISRSVAFHVASANDR